MAVAERENAVVGNTLKSISLSQMFAGGDTGQQQSCICRTQTAASGKGQWGDRQAIRQRRQSGASASAMGGLDILTRRSEVCCCRSKTDVMAALEGPLVVRE